MFHYLDNAATTQTRPEAAQAAVTAMDGGVGQSHPPGTPSASRGVGTG